jgi:hypothetical protein
LDYAGWVGKREVSGLAGFLGMCFGIIGLGGEKYI